MAELKETLNRHAQDVVSGNMAGLMGDFTPEAVRSHRLAGTLGGLLASAYVCRDCTKPGGWVLIE